MPLLGLVLTTLSAAAMAGASTPSRIWPAGVHLPVGEPISEDYRGQFDLCDQQGSFRGQTSRYTKSCEDDPNRVTTLRRLPGGAVAYVSKLAVDLDGSAFACGPSHGRMDQCPTSLMLRDASGGQVPVDSDAVPYVVIPEAGPSDVAGEFSRLTGVHVGDFGVVIARGRTVPVIVADTGPYSKLGEGSLALHRALGNEQCVTKDINGHCGRVDNEGDGISAGVTTILFPGSARDDIDTSNIAIITHETGLRLWSQLRQSHT